MPGRQPQSQDGAKASLAAFILPTRAAREPHQRLPGEGSRLALQQAIHQHRLLAWQPLSPLVACLAAIAIAGPKGVSASTATSRPMTQPGGARRPVAGVQQLLGHFLAARPSGCTARSCKTGNPAQAAGRAGLAPAWAGLVRCQGEKNR